MTPNNLQEEIKKLQEMISSNAMQVKDESISKEIANEHNDNDLHNEILRNVAESSIENHKQKRRLKTPFFLIVMIMYIIVIIGGIATTIIVLIAQIVFHFNSRFIPMYKGRTLKVYNIEQEGFQEYAEERLESMHIMITDVSIIQNGENTFDYIFCLEMPKDMREEVLIQMFRCERRIDVTY